MSIFFQIFLQNLYFFKCRKINESLRTLLQKECTYQLLFSEKNKAKNRMWQVVMSQVVKAKKQLKLFIQGHMSQAHLLSMSKIWYKH